MSRELHIAHAASCVKCGDTVALFDDRRIAIAPLSRFPLLEVLSGRKRGQQIYVESDAYDAFVDLGLLCDCSGCRAKADPVFICNVDIVHIAPIEIEFYVGVARGIANICREPFRFVAGGKGFSYEDAAKTTLGESYELYHSGTPLQGEITRDPSPAINAMFSLLFDRDDVRGNCAWTIVNDLHSGERYCCPASLVYFPGDAGWHELAHLQQTTSGLGAGRNYDDALHKALLELWERHCLMRTWFEAGQCFRVPPSAYRPETGSLLDNLANNGAVTKIYDIRRDARIPAVVSVIETNGGRLAVGASAGSSYDGAVLGSIAEALQILHFVEHSPPRRVAQKSDVRTPADHKWYYQPIERRGVLRQIFSDQYRSVDNCRPEHGNIEHELMSKDFTLFAKRLDAGDEPVAVVRALSGNLVPIVFGMGAPLQKILTNFPYTLRWSNVTEAEPHPLA